MPFEMTDRELPQITTPPTADIQKFIEITKKMCQLYLKSQTFKVVVKESFEKVKESIAPWITKPQDRNVIQTQIMYRIGRLLNAIEVQFILPYIYHQNELKIINSSLWLGYGDSISNANTH